MIDVGEPPEVFKTFDKKGIPYIRGEIRLWYCESCGTIYKKPLKKCIRTPKCGADGTLKSERVGDFTNTDFSWVVERKTEEDFVGSMLDKSLHNQAAKMAKFFSGWKFVLLEGFISVMVDNPHHKRPMKKWIKSMRVTLKTYNCVMWQCDDLNALADEVFRIEKKAGEEPRIFDKIDDKYKGWSDSKKIVCKLIDVSDKKADVLLGTFKTPMSVFNAIMESKVIFTSTGNPKGIEGPFIFLKGFGPKFILKNQKMLNGG